MKWIPTCLVLISGSVLAGPPLGCFDYGPKGYYTCNLQDERGNLTSKTYLLPKNKQIQTTNVNDPCAGLKYASLGKCRAMQEQRQQELHQLEVAERQGRLVTDYQLKVVKLLVDHVQSQGCVIVESKPNPRLDCP